MLPVACRFGLTPNGTGGSQSGTERVLYINTGPGRRARWPKAGKPSRGKEGKRNGQPRRKAWLNGFGTRNQDQEQQQPRIPTNGPGPTWLKAQNQQMGNLRLINSGKGICSLWFNPAKARGLGPLALWPLGLCALGPVGLWALWALGLWLLALALGPGPGPGEYFHLNLGAKPGGRPGEILRASKGEGPPRELVVLYFYGWGWVGSGAFLSFPGIFWAPRVPWGSPGFPRVLPGFPGSAGLPGPRFPGPGCLGLGGGLPLLEPRLYWKGEFRFWPREL